MSAPYFTLKSEGNFKRLYIRDSEIWECCEEKVVTAERYVSSPVMDLTAWSVLIFHWEFFHWLGFGLSFVQETIMNGDRFSLSYLFNGLHQDLYTRESASCRQTSLPAHKEILLSLNMLFLSHRFSKVWPCLRQICSHSFLHVLACFFSHMLSKDTSHK